MSHSGFEIEFFKFIDIFPSNSIPFSIFQIPVKLEKEKNYEP